jgi:hypothetical protein
LQLTWGANYGVFVLKASYAGSLIMPADVLMGKGMLTAYQRVASFPLFDRYVRWVARPRQCPPIEDVESGAKRVRDDDEDAIEGESAAKRARMC